jgi:tetratricopeptide (TPR) repeat protein
MRSKRLGRLFVAASLLAIAMHPRPGSADGAIAMGQTDTVGTDGLAFGAHYNDFDPSRIAGEARGECRVSAASERARNACTIIGTFHDRCFALAQDDKLTPHGAGLALAETRKAADAMALDQCRKMAGPAHSKACAVLRNGCDGEAAFRGDPIDATGFNDRAFAYLNQHDYDHAAADFGAAIKFNPQNVAAYNDRAAAYKLKGDLDRALADCDQAIALDPKYAGAYNNRGTVHLARRDYDLAIADFGEAIKLNPNDAGPLYSRGQAKLKSGDTAGGEADIAAAKALRPDIGDASAQPGDVAR